MEGKYKYVSEYFLNVRLNCIRQHRAKVDNIGIHNDKSSLRAASVRYLPRGKVFDKMFKLSIS